MKQRMFWTIIAVALVAGLALAGGNTFRHAGDEFDLSDLRDGESRSFGEGGQSVKVLRSGDAIVISPSSEARGEITCRLATDRCVIVESNDGDDVTIKIDRRIECDTSDGSDCEDVDVMVLGDHGHAGGNVWVEKIKECEGDDCEVEVIVKRAGGDGEMMFIGEGGGHAVVEMLTPFHRGNVLSCPEGDATLRVDDEEASDTFLCPKHSVPMVKSPAGGTKLRKKIVVRSDGS